VTPLSQGRKARAQHALDVAHQGIHLLLEDPGVSAGGEKKKKKKRKKTTPSGI
jgi:hypothetical protein